MSAEHVRAPDDKESKQQSAVKVPHPPFWRKCMIVLATSWITLSACFSSTVFFSVVKEVSDDFNASPSTINLANSGVLLTLDMSTLIWGPVEIFLGRRIAYNGCICVLIALTIIAGVVPSVQGFIVVRVLSGFQGTYFHVAAQTIFAENFPPTQRGTATGFFLAGVVLGSPLGPLVAAIIVTYQSWRVILWLQTGMLLLGLALSILFIKFGPTNQGAREDSRSARERLASCSPLRVFEMMRKLNILATSVACGLLAWSQFTLLAIPRHVISSRFQLGTPIIAGIFYLAPACGFLIGSIAGGRLSDRTVRRWIKQRNGVRLPEDRLRSGVVSFFVLIPTAYLIFGWGMQCNTCSRSRLAVLIITAFVAAAGIFDAMAGLNTYCAEAIPSRKRDAIASKYMIQYSFSAVASGVAVALIDLIGLGTACTINVVLVLVGAILTNMTARYGSRMQRWAEDETPTDETDRAHVNDQRREMSRV